MSWRKGNKLRLLPETEANGRIAEIYLQIKETLGVPRVSTIFQAFAAYPQFLEKVWQVMEPAAHKEQFYQLGERIRAEAYTRIHNYFAVPDLWESMDSSDLGEESKQGITRIVDLFHYLDPLVLLIAVTQMRAFEVPVGHEISGSTVERPGFTQPLVPGGDAPPPRIHPLYDDIIRTLDLPVLLAPYTAFAHYPAFLESYWSALKPISQSAMYTQCQIAMKDTAWSLMGNFPVRVDLTVARLSEAGISDDDIIAVMRITELFADVLSREVLNLALAKIGLEGGSRTATPPGTPPQGQPKKAA